MIESYLFEFLGVENFPDLFLNIVKILIAAFIALVLHKIGTYIINKYVSKAKNELIDEELVNFVTVSLKKILKYGLIFVVILVSLEIFDIDVIGASEIRLAGTTIVKTAVIIVLAKILLGLGRQLITHIFERSDIKKQMINERRRHTLAGLLKNVLKYAVYFIAGLMILENFGVKTSSILAGVGVAGLAISFGAQSLIKDVITGFFIMFEDQYNVGDFVTAAGVTGIVEELGLRTSKIKEWTGELHIIPNGEIGQVKNFSKDNIIALVFMDIAYEEDIDEAISVFEEEGKKAAEELEAIIEEPLVHGVVELGDSYVRIRIGTTCVPGEQWAIERELTRRFKKALDREGIEIPYPRRVLISKNTNENAKDTNISQEDLD
ncbi:mechanosensitive ion channel family protein [Natranaerofaba carboxydovora]|uniref:mechanosensitive ion channel family protein n=1 Tax=Natranaerofaba carboxydovora TaxID=2742683 RepID=UPI001F13F686|nr:mechanosensitive ion channel family protein [Natranaerofaba carboxydovora]UMZ74836.1 putative MscS family protein YkuT [Natranaerofaba carboxydovora]